MFSLEIFINAMQKAKRQNDLVYDFNSKSIVEDCCLNVNLSTNVFVHLQN